MPIINLFDRVKQKSTTAGSGNITFTSSVAAFVDFSGVYTDGDELYYAIENLTDFEVGIGTYSGNALSRDQVLKSSNSDNLLNLPGDANTFVYNTYAASGAVYTSGDRCVQNIDSINFNLGANPAYAEGRIFYDSENHALSVYNDESEITLQVGQEEYLRVRNNTDGVISNGEAVRIEGSQGTHVTVEKAIATGDFVAQAIGLATHDIEQNSFGYVTTYGVVNDVDTSDFNDGDEIFLSPEVSGGLTGVSPIAPNYKLSLGHVVRSHPTVGRIVVKPSTPKLGGGDVKSLGNKVASGVAFTEQIAGTDAAIIASYSGLLYDSGNSILQVNGGGVRFPDGATQTIAYTGQDADGLSSAVTVQLSNQATGSATFQNGGDTADISTFLTAAAISGQGSTSSIADADKILIERGAALRQVRKDILVTGLATESYVNTVSGNLQTQITSNDGDISTLQANDTIISGIAQGAADDVDTVSGLIPTGTASGVAFFNSDNTISSSYANTGLIYDSGNQRLGIGITPTESLEIGGNNCSLQLHSPTYNQMQIESTAQLNIDYGQGGAIRFRSDGATLMQGDAARDLGVGGGPGTSQLQVTNDTTTDVGLTVVGAAAQSANLQEWQDSAGNTYSAISDVGNLIINTGVDIQIYHTGTDGDTDYERLRLYSDNNLFWITSEAGGVGSQHSIRIGDSTEYIQISTNGLLIRANNQKKATFENTIEFNDDILPDSNNTFDVGSTARVWNNLYVNTGIFYSGVQFPDGVTQTVAYTGQGGGSDPTGTASGVAFFGSDNNLADISTFVFDSGNNQLGLGTGVPGGQLHIVDTWDDVNTAYTGILVDITDTASSGTSDIFALRSDGVRRALFDVNGNISAQCISTFTTYGRLGTSGPDGAGNKAFQWNNDAFTSIGRSFRLADQTDGASVSIFRDASNTLAQRGGANAQEFRIYHSGTSSDGNPTNYERLSIKANAYNYEISPQVNGGTAGSVIITNDTSSQEILVVKGAASQTANLQEWQDSAGTVNASIDQDGFAVFNGFRTSAAAIFNGSAGNQLTFSNANTTFSHQGYLDILIDSNDNSTTDYFRVSKDSRTAANILLNVDNDGNISGAGTGIFQSGIQFPDGVTQTVAYTGQETSPGGSDTYVQFNDGGSFGGDANFTWNTGTDTLTVSGAVDITGALTATTKSFLIDHPTKEGMKLQYASLEGPENGVYVRGTTDQSTIQLPDYWVGLVDENSITVTLTPIGSFQQLYVENKSNKQITVGGVWGSYDYVVYGERKDVDKLEVEW
jgi:hypothetical protein